MSLFLKKLVWLGCSILSLTTLHADPAWWGWGWAETGNVAFHDSGMSDEPLSPVNLGQLKHAALCAYLYLEYELDGEGGAGSASGRISSFYNTSTGQPVIGGDNEAIANIGQLKYIAEGFYLRLLEIGYDPRTQLQSLGGDYAHWPHMFPWTPGIEDDNNYAPVTLGQLKAVFSFDLTGVLVGDPIEIVQPPFLNDSSDYDGDLFSRHVEDMAGSSPQGYDDEDAPSNWGSNSAVDQALSTHPGAYPVIVLPDHGNYVTEHPELEITSF